ncbi:MAG: hypothetical protein L3K10_01915 [Thermoplasmata archaeon]|nr:hypothetical protein [Thermoplasmata archaeon]
MTLAPIASVDASAMRWLRTGSRPPAFELWAGDQRVESLRWSKSTGSYAEGESSDARWTLKRGGFLHPHTTLRRAGDDGDVARITLHLGEHRRSSGDPPGPSPLVGEYYHKIDFAGGETYRFHRAGVHLPAWKITTDQELELVHIEPIREGRTLTGAAVLVTPDGVKSTALGNLLLFSWYFIVLAWFEDEALLPFEKALSEVEKL